MKITDLLSLTDFTGQISPAIGTKDIGAVLGGDRTGTDLVPVTLRPDGGVSLTALFGTALDPSEHLMVHGVKVPGAMCNGHIRVEELRTWDKLCKKFVSEGLFWQLDAYAVALHFAIRATGAAVEPKMHTLCVQALDALAGDHETHVLRVADQWQFRGTAALDLRLADEVMGTPIPMADALLDLMKQAYGDKAPTTYEELGHWMLQVKRYPTGSADMIRNLRLQVILEDVKVFRFNDRTIKLYTGDFDGDQLISLLKDFLADLIAVPGEGLPVLPAPSDPWSIGGPSFELKDVGFGKRPDSVQHTSGLGMKSAQGPIHNGWENLAIAAAIKVSEFVNSRCYTCQITSGSLIKHLFPNGTEQRVVQGGMTAYVTQVTKKSGLAVFEVVFDFRKYADGDHDRFEDGLFNCLDIFSGQSTTVGQGIRDIEKGTKETPMGVDADLFSAILASLQIPGAIDANGRVQAEALRDYNARYPVQGTLVGWKRMAQSKKRLLTGRLAQFIAAHDGAEYLLACTGHRIEKPDSDAVPMEEGGEKEAPKPAAYGFGKKQPVDTGSFIDDVRAWASWAGTHPVFLKESGTAGDAEWAMRLPCINKYAAATKQTAVPIMLGALESIMTPSLGEGRLGTQRVRTPGADWRTAAMALRANNINWCGVGETGGVSLTSFAQRLGEHLAGWSYKVTCAIRKAQETKTTLNLPILADEIRQDVQQWVLKNTRLPGTTDRGGRTAGEVSLGEYEADVILADRGGIQGCYRLNRTLLSEIQHSTFINPLNRNLRQRFDVGLTSKSNPGCVATLHMPVLRFTQDGSFHSHASARPAIEHVVNCWITTERQMRESRSVRFAAELMYEHPLAFTTGYEDLFPEITQRRRDGIWLVVANEWFMSCVGNNGDTGGITPYGMSVYRKKSRPRVEGPMSVEMLENFAEGEGCEDIPTLKAAGWRVKETFLFAGKIDGKSYFSLQYELTLHESKESTWHKIYICGHKFVATPTSRDYWVLVNGEYQPVLGVVPEASMIAKKLSGSMACALSVLLGRTYFGKLADQPVSPDRVAGDDPEAHDDIVADCARRLREHGWSPSGTTHVYSHGPDGGFESVGRAFAGIFPTFVMKEDEEIGTGGNDQGRDGLLDKRMMNELAHLSPKVMKRMETFAKYIAGESV